MKYLLISLSYLIIGSSTDIWAQNDVRYLDDFTEISVSGNVEVILFKGTPKAEITMLRGNMEDLELNVDDGKLKIGIDNNWWGKKNAKARITLYFSELDKVSVSAGASLEGKEEVSAHNMDIDVSSGADLEMELKASRVTVDVSSGANARLGGTAKYLDVDVSSGAEFNGGQLKVDEVVADASSGAKAKLWVIKSLTADAGSGGSIIYRGDPPKKNIDAGKYSGGSIKSM